MPPDDGLIRFQKRMAAIPKEVRAAIKPALMKSGQELQTAMRRLAETSRDTGALIDSITVTGPGETTPPYSQPGGSKVVPENAVAVTVGNTDVRYPHLVEYGTTKAHAQPFFWPAFRLYRKRITRRINRAINKAIKDSKR